MIPDILHHFEAGKLRPAASESIVAKLQQELGVVFPDEYAAFLKLTDGYEGRIGKNGYAMLWSTEEVPEMIRNYPVDEYVPGFLLFGSSGGGEAYGFDTRTPGWPIVRIPWIPMEWEEALPLGNTFSEFLQHISEEG